MSETTCAKDRILAVAAGAPWKFTWAYPSIPQAVLAKARRKLPSLGPDEEVLVLVNASPHWVYSHWIALTDKKLHWRFLHTKGCEAYEDLQSAGVQEALGQGLGDLNFLKIELTKKDGSKTVLANDMRKNVTFGPDYPMNVWIEDLLAAAIAATPAQRPRARTDMAAAMAHVESGKTHFWRVWSKEDLYALPLSVIAFAVALLVSHLVLRVVVDKYLLGFCGMLTVGLAAGKLFGLRPWLAVVMIAITVARSYAGHQEGGNWVSLVPNWAVFPSVAGISLGLYCLAAGIAGAIARQQAAKPPYLGESADTVRYSCPHCGVELENDRSTAGQEDVCPSCGKTSVVPAESAAMTRRE